ncbi:MAG: DNA polymerase III subunit beta [Paludibacteraceae bacterium]|nr:DNA polymerase III subunit beta [Paludibacteraceae bacterium]MEE1095785.1 DNA polymerase III subunit beta [Paludibacteraceae bacterium]
MKFNVSSSKLFSQLQAVSRVINSKNALPILDDVLFELVGNELKLTASDGETTVRTAIEVEGAEGGGKVASAAKLLLETLKEFSEQPLAFTIDEQNFAVNMVSQNGTYSFVGVNGNEYPEMPQDEVDAQELSLPATTLQSAIEKTIFCTADDPLRPVMNGIYFDILEDRLILVATDAHRLVRYSNTSVKVGMASNFILPKKPAALLKNLLAKEEAEVKVTFGQKNARFEFDKTIVVCRRIEGRFPNYNAVIPQSNQNVVTVDRQTMVNACKRVAVFANNGTAQLRLALSENQIKISAQDIDFSTSAEEMIQCDYQGMSMAIGFKAPFLIDLLSTVGTTDVQLKLADPARAGLILPVAEEGEENVLMLLMPMLLND